MGRCQRVLRRLQSVATSTPLVQIRPYSRNPRTAGGGRTDHQIDCAARLPGLVDAQLWYERPPCSFAAQTSGTVKSSFRDDRSQVGFDEFDIPTSRDNAEIQLEFWCWMYRERAVIRQRDRGYPFSKAELLAWRELECRWHMAHCEPAAAGVCAGCQQPIGGEGIILLIDGNRVHDRNGHGCLIQYGGRWRNAAAAALIAIGLQPPPTSGS